LPEHWQTAANFHLLIARLHIARAELQRRCDAFAADGKLPLVGHRCAAEFQPNGSARRTHYSAVTAVVK